MCDMKKEIVEIIPVEVFCDDVGGVIHRPVALSDEMTKIYLRHCHTLKKGDKIIIYHNKFVMTRVIGSRDRDKIEVIV